MSTVGKVYGRHISNAHEKEINNQDDGLDHQKEVKDPVNRNGKGKKPNRRKGKGVMIDLHIEYTTRCGNDDDSSTDFSFDSNLDMIRNEIEEDDNLMVDEGCEVVVDQPTPTTHGELLVSPNVGMAFVSYDDVIGYYHEFGRQNGFQIKVRGSQNAKGEEVENGKDCTKVRLTCTKEGKFVPKGKDPSKPSRTQVTGCKTKITTTFDKKIGEWTLTTVVLEHNHPLDPLNCKFMPNYRYISPHNKEIMFTNEKVGCLLENLPHLQCVMEDMVQFLS
ncbi:hypothetical protein V6N11_079967 [Hibiscus sabdariffa]|uniref:FAR1 domain-containing protein n=1 Tax=Hibiscus sabdariffa TaxID=183260 RepID=A0ABR2RX21_9ROSI